MKLPPNRPFEMTCGNQLCVRVAHISQDSPLLRDCCDGGAPILPDPLAAALPTDRDIDLELDRLKAAGVECLEDALIQSLSLFIFIYIYIYISIQSYKIMNAPNIYIISK